VSGRAPGRSWSAAVEPMRVFGSIRPLDARSLAGPVVNVEVSAGTELTHEGGPVGTFFLIRAGSALLVRGDRPVGTLGAGDCFGEIDPRAPTPQRYTIVAITPLRLVTFSALGISRLCDAVPGARERILESLPGRRAEVHSLPLPASARVRASVASV